MNTKDYIDYAESRIKILEREKALIDAKIDELRYGISHIRRYFKDTEPVVINARVVGSSNDVIVESHNGNITTIAKV